MTTEKSIHARMTTDRILDVARRHFARFGYRKSSLVDIAKELGVVKGALYYHVPGGKRQLLELVWAREDERMYELMTSAAAAHDAPDEALVAAVEAKVRHLRELSDLYAVRRDVGFELATVLREGERDAKQRERELLETIIARGETAGAFREFRPRAVAASAIQALVEAMAAADIYDAPQGTDGHRLIDAVLDLLLSGLKRRP